ncbi:TIGR00730 family Rossman fold protein [[Clostridium] aminophilum]|uniref:Cytokinin riboside 5'-monophosphate phosphoribohydrolase n=1 Tax=[Clostridium] aminophilum TaxID=1526 RepID=A0A1I6JN37_9FIRM|nr:TIGR00730 family Rossman fold protein [[Clostridium] aminophilum]SFR80402.1 hypothetical protein SAMN02910262_01737 [[Clostridium] aminophilum]
MNITVYLGSSFGKDEKYRRAAERLGTWIGENGHRLIYGGSRVGLMGVLSTAVLGAGGHVIGVEPEFFVKNALQNEDIDELIVTKDMRERKGKMIELGDAFIAFPGGTGTLEEITEVMEMTTLARIEEGKEGGIDSPCIFFNLDGYYDHIRALLLQMVEAGFLEKHRLGGVHFAESLEEIVQILTSGS